MGTENITYDSAGTWSPGKRHRDIRVGREPLIRYESGTVVVRLIYADDWSDPRIVGVETEVFAYAGSEQSAKRNLMTGAITIDPSP